ncbi:MAG: hypothetical protein WCQ60_01710 [bacterium]
MNKSFVRDAIIACAVIGLVCYLHSRVHTPQVATSSTTVLQVAKKAKHPTHAVPAPMVAEDAPVVVVAEEAPSNGLIKLQLNTTFSSQLPSAAAQKEALALNELFKQEYGKTNGQ